MRSRANDAAILAGLFWCVGGIDLNAPQLDRVVLLIAGVALLGLSLRGNDEGPFICWYAFLIGTSERLSRAPLLDGSDVLRATQEALRTHLKSELELWATVIKQAGVVPE